MWVDCLSTSCPNDYGNPRAYVKVTMDETFSTTGYYPSVPTNVPLSLSGYMRVQ